MTLTLRAATKGIADSTESPRRERRRDAGAWRA